MSAIEHPDHERIFALVEGELDVTESTRLREHVTGCPECLSYSQLLQRGIQAFAEYHRESSLRLPPPPTNWRPAERRHQPVAVLCPMAWVAAAVAAALLIAVLPRGESDTELVNRVNAQLSQALPQPLEPMLKLVSSDYPKVNSK